MHFNFSWSSLSKSVLPTLHRRGSVLYGKNQRHSFPIARDWIVALLLALTVAASAGGYAMMLWRESIARPIPEETSLGEKDELSRLSVEQVIKSYRARDAVHANLDTAVIEMRPPSE